jgi:hypothetical protein
MKKNLGTADRVIRILLAVVLAYVYYGGWVTGTAGMVLLAVGIVLVLTSVVSFCPLYKILGLSSTRTASK